MKKKQLLLILALLCLIPGCAGGRDEFLRETIRPEDYQESDSLKSEELPSTDTVPETEAPSLPSIYVDVEGAVNAPGVYVLPEGSRVYEALLAAGGSRPDAALRYVNQARLLSDGSQLYIPTQEDIEKREGRPEAFEEIDDGEGSLWFSPGTASVRESKVNINTADLQTLCTINGIGEVRAKAILAYREKNGRFASIEELTNVDGIKGGTLEKIRGQITVG